MTDLNDYSNLDPRGYYILKARKAESVAQGAEWLAYQIFGFQNIGSWAFALDPLSGFRKSGQQATPVNRTRKFSGYGTPNTLKSLTVKRTITGDMPLNLTTPDPFDRVPYSERVTASSRVVASITTQPLVQGEILDTTYRTRPLGSVDGEFELWKPQIRARGGVHFTVQENDTYQYNPAYARIRVANVVDTSFVGPCATISALTVSNLRAGMKTQLLSDMGDNVLSMLSRTVPNRRIFSLARYFGELKDIPRTIAGRLETLVAARKSVVTATRKRGARQLAAEYVSYQFGWEQLYKDIVKLVNYPEQFAKKLNFLMRRNGKLTTLRFEMDLPPRTVASPPAFVMYMLEGESQKSLTHEAVTFNKLRLAVNVLVDFPRLDVPEFRRALYLHDLGVNPTPEDVYNLVPWTWLIDWFTGIGDYVAAYDNVNQDPDLINYGFVTGISTLRSRSVHCVKRVCTNIVSVTPPVPAWTQTTVMPNEITREARLDATLQIRRTLTSAYGVKPSWDFGSLSDYQLSILGALFYLQSPK